MDEFFEKEKDCPPTCRRNHERVKIDTTSEISSDEHQGRFMIVRDISVQGAGIMVSFPLRMNENITIILGAPIFRNPVHQQARVVWHKQFDKDLWHVGLDFGTNKLSFS